MSDKADVPELDETTLDEAIARFASFTEALFATQALLLPVHPSLDPDGESDDDGISKVMVQPDPDEVVKAWDLSKAESRGEPIDSDEYPEGTWFFHGSEYALVGEAGPMPVKIIRRESLVD